MRAAIVAGVFLRASLLVFYLATHGWKGETWEYEELAVSWLEGRGYLYLHHGVPLRSAYMPLFPTLCAFLHWIGGKGLWLFYLVNLGFAAGLIAATHSLARRTWGERAADISAWLVAIEPALIVYQSYKVDAVPLASLLLVLSLLLLRDCSEAPNAFNAAKAGAVAALATLTRPDMIVFWAAPGVWLVRRRFAQESLMATAAAGLAFTAVLSPWVARNFLLHGRFMPSTTLSGVNLWIGNNPNSTGTPWARTGQTQWQAAPEAFRATVKAGPELAADDAYKREALAHIASRPWEAGARWGRAFVYFWWFAPDYSKRLYYGWVPGAGWIAYRAWYAALFSLILLGTVSAIRERAELPGWIWACALGMAAMHSVHFVEGRHRLLVMPLLLVIAAKGFDDLRVRFLRGQA